MKEIKVTINYSINRCAKCSKELAKLKDFTHCPYCGARLEIELYPDRFAEVLVNNKPINPKTTIEDYIVDTSSTACD